MDPLDTFLRVQHRTITPLSRSTHRVGLSALETRLRPSDKLLRFKSRLLSRSRRAAPLDTLLWAWHQTTFPPATEEAHLHDMISNRTGQPMPDTLLQGKANQLLAPLLEPPADTLPTGQVRRHQPAHPGRRPSRPTHQIEAI